MVGEGFGGRVVRYIGTEGVAGEDGGDRSGTDRREQPFERGDGHNDHPLQGPDTSTGSPPFQVDSSEKIRDVRVHAHEIKSYLCLIADFTKPPNDDIHDGDGEGGTVRKKVPAVPS